MLLGFCRSNVSSKEREASAWMVSHISHSLLSASRLRNNFLLFKTRARREQLTDTLELVDQAG